MKLHFVRSIRGLQNFLAIPIMNPLAGFMISELAKYWNYYSIWNNNRIHLYVFKISKSNENKIKALVLSNELVHKRTSIFSL